VFDYLPAFHHDDILKRCNGPEAMCHNDQRLVRISSNDSLDRFVCSVAYHRDGLVEYDELCLLKKHSRQAEQLSLSIQDALTPSSSRRV
jgi:hypothetical protein